MSNRFPAACGGRPADDRQPPVAALSLGLAVCAALLSTVDAAVARAEGPPPEPYVVFVADEQAYARCGPSGEYYRTDPLRMGQELEVYLATEDGWLGIRPPENSFSWLLASSVERIAGTDTARVTDPQAVAWIGTSLGRARKYRWQVQLAEGEEVVIVGRSDREGQDGTEQWYRIVPPSGEFRWVHRSQTVDTAEALVAVSRQRQTEREPRRSSLAAEQAAPKHQADTDRTTAGDHQPQDAGVAQSSRSGAESAEGSEPASAAADQSVLESGGLQQTLQGIAQALSVDNRPVGSGVAPTVRAAASDSGDVAHNGPASAGRPVAEPELTIGNQVVLRDIAAPRSASSVAAASTPSGGGRDTAASIASTAEPWTQGVRQAGATAPQASADRPRSLSSDPARSAGTLTPTAPPVLQEVTAADAEPIRALQQRIQSADVAQLQLELSRQMAAAASAAMVQPIRQRAQQWVQRLNDPAEQDRARLLLERVEQYQRVALRRSGQSDVLPAMATEPTAAADAPAPPVDIADGDQPAADPPADAAPQTPPAFDRQGYLVQVYSARPDAPPFALTDGSGRTLAYVSPTPGLNLRRYLNSQVGVYGRLGYHTGLETPHVIAERAVEIGR